jgi:alkylation response protein AidB-like acyl-CoA dehydrogenase
VDVADSPEQAAFRAEARAWLEANAVPKGHPDDFSSGFSDPGYDAHALVDRCRDWQRTLFEAGWAGISFPSRYGGRGGTPVQELIFVQEMSRFGVTNGSFSVAHNMVAPVVLALGTQAQREAFLVPMWRGDDVWCQLFSEPGAGSDLAGVATRAVRDGDEFVVNGQKVWTSHADRSQRGILLARSDPDVPKHRGLTYFLVDMDTPGIEVRVLKEMTGGIHFCEVFLTDVRIPASRVLGGEEQSGNGWRAAMHTLANERAMMGTAPTDDDVEKLFALARRAGRLDDPLVRVALADAWMGARIIDYFGYRARTALGRGEQPGPESSVVKLFYTNYLKRIASLAMELRGPEGMLAGEGDGAYFRHRFLYAPSLGIAGGTSEVQRTVIGDRVLGLPSEPRPDRDAPFRPATDGGR